MLHIQIHNKGDKIIISFLFLISLFIFIAKNKVLKSNPINKNKKIYKLIIFLFLWLNLLKIFSVFIKKNSNVFLLLKSKNIFFLK